MSQQCDRSSIISLQATLDAFKADFEAGKPPYNAPRAAIELMHRATAELAASGAAARVLKAGDRAPAFMLADPDSRPILPMPGRFVIGRDGIVRYAEVNPDYTRRPEPLDLLPALGRRAA